jgi:putative salt-induced outer membrane protein YdiY
MQTRFLVSSAVLVFFVTLAASTAHAQLIKSKPEDEATADAAAGVDEGEVVEVEAASEEAIKAAPAAVEKVLEEEAWQPPEPDDSSKDWVQLVSGEWIGGTIEKIDDGSLYFDSDELDDLTLDWSDIAAFRSSKVNTYRFVGRRILTGTAVMQDGEIRISTPSGVSERQRANLVSMIEGEPKEINYWSGMVNFGLAARTGNSEQADVTGVVEIRRRTALTRAFLGYNGAYSVVTTDTTTSETITNSHRATGVFDLFITRRFFVTMPSLEAFYDEFQNIGFRGTVGAGVGYELFDTAKFDWEVSFQGAYQYLNYDQKPVSDPKTNNDAAVVFSTTFEIDPTGDIEWDTTYKAQITVTDLGKTSQHVLSVFSFDVWGPLDLDVTFNWDYIASPPAVLVTLNPLVIDPPPESNDFRLSIGLGFDW